MLHPQRLLPVDAGALCLPDLVLYPLLVHAAVVKIRMRLKTKKTCRIPVLEVIFFDIFIAGIRIQFLSISLEMFTIFSLACSEIKPG